MAVRTTVEVDGAIPVVCQRALPGDSTGREYLHARARALHGAAGAGVVAVVRSGPTADGGWDLVTRYGGPPLDPGRLLGPVGLASVAAQVASVLADVHGRGVVHGGLEREQVLMGPGGAILICGFGTSTAGPADDVAAVGRIVDELLSELVPPRTSAERRLTAALQSIVEAAQAADADRRPSARRLAADFEAVAGRAAHAARSWTTRRPVAGLGAAAATAVLVGAAALVAAPGSAGRVEPARPVAPRSEAVPPFESPPTSAAEVPPCVASVDRAVHPDGACPHAIEVLGATVVVDGRHVVVGRPGDEVLAADWGCEGGVRPAVLRPGTGEVLVYGAIASEGGPVVVHAARIAGATELVSSQDDGGCLVLGVRTEAGITRVQ